MKIKVLLFGMLADLANANSLEIENAADIDSLLSKVYDSNKNFREAKFVIALNKKVIHVNQQINEDDEVALLPPFAGG